MPRGIYPRTKEHNMKISKAWMGNQYSKGKRMSEETKQKISRAHTGRKHTEQSRRNMSIAHIGQISWNKGKKMNDEFRRKVSEGLTGKYVGEKGVNWKGNDITYRSFHTRLYKIKGQPKKCEVCGKEGGAGPRGYQWANLTGRYNDPDDYKRMCITCHMKYDRDRRRR